MNNVFGVFKQLRLQQRVIRLQFEIISRFPSYLSVWRDPLFRKGSVREGPVQDRYSESFLNLSNIFWIGPFI